MAMLSQHALSHHERERETERERKRKREREREREIVFPVHEAASEAASFDNIYLAGTLAGVR